jgi:hypothetical protein
MRRLAGLFCLIAFAGIYLVALERSGVEARTLPRGAEGAGVLPAPFLKVLSLEFDGLAADLLFIEGLAFYGETLERTTKPRLQEWEWQWLFNTFKTATEIDPWFYDPYYLVNANFPWEGRLIRETDALLERGAAARTWDWTLPFYAGFNEFYFLHNNERGSELLMEAARRPGSSPFIPGLAARLAYQGNRTENAIRFLVEFLQTVENPVERKQYETRLEALKGIYLLEQGVKGFENKFQRLPLALQELVDAGLVSALPEDPYGGRFFIAADGSVGTTSELRQVP